MADIVLNHRKEIVDVLIPYARRDSRIVLLVCDMGFGVIDNFREEFPNRIFNAGIMEQATVGIAAGMAMTGLKPIVYSIVNFLVFRALEQVRNDVVLQKLDVKFISTGVNNYFNFLGSSHCCGKDDVEIMRLINMNVYDPYEDPNVPFDKVVEDWIMDPGPAYIRV